MTWSDSFLNAETRFWARVWKTDSCWLWLGAPTGPKGYGQLRVNGKKIGAHCFSYFLEYGLIPEGLFVCHECDTPLCVNPQHLFLGTNSDNLRDAIRKGFFRPKEYRSRCVVPMNGDKVSVSEAARALGVGWHTIARRIQPGAREKRLDAPTTKDVFLTFKDKTLNLKQWAIETGVPYSTICARQRRGWRVERILCNSDGREQRSRNM